MDFLEAKPKRTIVILLALALINLLAFAWFFGFHPNNDTDSYIETIQFFRGESPVVQPNRYLNPFYPVVAAKVLFFVSPAQSLIILNIIFYFALVLLTYGLVRRVFADRTAGFITALLVASAYPMLRYSLTQVQDIGGYVWLVAALYTAWRWHEEEDNRWLWLGGIAVAFGVLTKESGCMGALFAGIIMLFHHRTWRQTLGRLGIFALPGVVTILINSWRGHDVGYSSGRWFIDNWHIYAAENYHFIKWFGVNVSTYNLAWPFALYGLFYLIKNWRVIERDVKLFFLAVLLPSVSYFAWPVFISRTVFVSAWLMLPLAVYGVVKVSEKVRRSEVVLVVCTAVLVVTPFMLQSTLRYTHIFQIMDKCQRNVPCIWQTFWQERVSVSTEK